MLKASMQNKQGKTDEIELSNNKFELYKRVHRLGFCGVMSFCLPLTNEADTDIRIRLSSDSDFGNALIKLLSEKDTLGDAYLLDTVVSNAREEIKEALEQDILCEQFDNRDELYAAIRGMTILNAPHKLSFYCPLEGEWDDRESEKFLPLSNDELFWYQKEIEEALAYVQADLDMAKYVGEYANMSDKVWLAEWHIENIGGALYGRIDCYLTEPPTESETETLRKAVLWQNSDDFGRSFEQSPIKIDGWDVYVSFWNSGKDYFLRTETEMEEHLQKSNVKMGGI